MAWVHILSIIITVWIYIEDYRLVFVCNPLAFNYVLSIGCVDSSLEFMYFLNAGHEICCI